MRLTLPTARGLPDAHSRSRAASLGLLCLGLGSCADEADAPPQAQPERSPASIVSELAAPSAPAALLWFEDAGKSAGLDLLNVCGSEREVKRTILESIGQGAAWIDDDGDGALDLFIANGSAIDGLPTPAPTNRYYRNAGGGRFQDVSSAAGIDTPGWCNGVAAADLEGDGDTDLFVTVWGPQRLYVNQGLVDGQPHFQDRATELGVDGLRRDSDGALLEQSRPWGTSAAWGDIDNDGLLDLFVCHYLAFDPKNPPNGGKTQNWKGVRDAYYGPLGCTPQQVSLYRQRAQGTFEDVTSSSRVGKSVPAYALGCLFTDFDADGDADIYVANDSMRNYLLVNDGSGQFDEKGDVLGVGFGEGGNAQAGMGVDAADYDNDGDDDLVVTNFDDDINTLYSNEGRTFRDLSTRTGIASYSRHLLCWGVSLTDFDHDGDRELFVAAGHVYPRAETDDPTSRYFQQNQLLSWTGKRFEDVSNSAGPAFQVRESSRGAAFGDYDADGDVDALVVNLNAQPTLYRNATRGAQASIVLRLHAKGANREALGARVRVLAGSSSWSAERRAGASFQSTNSPWMHFGLGEVQRVERIEVRWPSGKRGEYGPFDLSIGEGGFPTNRIWLEE